LAGLAGSDDRPRRFDPADRAHAQAIGIIGPTSEILNNQDYAYMLRGDYNRAREKLNASQRKDPATNTCRIICSSWKTATARARPSNRSALPRRNTARRRE